MLLFVFLCKILYFLIGASEIWRTPNLLPSCLSTKPTLLIMPRVVQPSGLLQTMRVRYTARRKLALLASAKRIVEEDGLTLRRAAERLMVCHSLFVR
jgi:hypothetical protein